MIFVGILAIGFANAQGYFGNVGINTSTPSATLNVKSLSGRTTSETKNLELENGAGTKLVTVLNNGNVGLGTGAPTMRLNIVNNGSGIDYLADEGLFLINKTSRSVSAGIQSIGGVEIASDINNHNLNSAFQGVLFKTSQVERMRIAQNGNVGIGNSSPSEKLEVGGNVLANGGLISKSDTASGSYVELSNTSKTTGKAVDRWRIFNLNNVDTENYVPGLHFWAYAADGTNLSSQMLITDEGNVGIGFNSRVTGSIQTNEKLEVNGKIRITAQTTVTENGSCTNKGTIAFGSDGNFYGCTGTGTGAGTWKKLNN